MLRPAPLITAANTKDNIVKTEVIPGTDVRLICKHRDEVGSPNPAAAGRGIQTQAKPIARRPRVA